MIENNGQEMIFMVVRQADGEFAYHGETSIFETPEDAGTAAAEWMGAFAEILRRAGHDGTADEIFDRMMGALFTRSDEILGITGNTMQ